MTLARTKDNLLESLADSSNRVVALSGKWGTGKTHLWTEVQKASTDEVVKNAVSVSLFGANSISDLKLKIAQKLLPKIGDSGALSESIRNGLSGMRKLLTSLHKGFSALDELALIATPMMMKGRFIVIDDIERKHEKLSIDEVLGFIDDCVHNLDCRILIILNSDQLGDKKIWDLFREKVIDQELRLETSPAEAFDIAVKLTPTNYAAELKKAVEACKVVNIRIIRKVIKVSNRLLANRGALAPCVVARVVPSTTILSAIHYKGLDDGPDFDFMLKFETTFMAMMAREAEKKGESETPEAKARERWRLLLDEVGFRGADEFEALVVDFLKSGLIDSGAVGKIIDRYVAEGQALEAREQAHAFSDRVTWHPEITDAQLVDELRALIPGAGLLDMFTVTSLHYQAGTIAGGAPFGEEIVQAWVTAFRAQHPPGQEPKLDPDFNFFHRPLHPDIEAEIKAVQTRTQSTATIIEVCRRVAEDRAWGAREESLMQSITPTAYEAAIQSATGRELRLLLLQSTDFVKNRAMYEAHFGGGVQAFVDACRGIFAREPTSRIGQLVRTLFADAKMEALISPPAPAVVVPAPAAAATPSGPP
jgi:hypothetical protein